MTVGVELPEGATTPGGVSGCGEGAWSLLMALSLLVALSKTYGLKTLQGLLVMMSGGDTSAAEHSYIWIERMSVLEVRREVLERGWS